MLLIIYEQCQNLRGRLFPHRKIIGQDYYIDNAAVRGRSPHNAEFHVHGSHLLKSSPNWMRFGLTLEINIDGYDSFCPIRICLV